MKYNRPMGISLMDETPHLKLNDEQLKSIKSWDVGKKYTITLNVTMHEKEMSGQGGIEGCFYIDKVSE
jgi:hypothetical protein